MSSDVSSPKNSLDEITLVMEYLSLRDDISATKENCSLNAIKVAYDSLQKLKQLSTPEDLKACIDMSKSPDAKFLEICITSLVLDSRNSVILDKILDDIPCVLQLLLKRMYRLRWEEVNDFWRLLEALCTSSGRIGTIASCFAHYLVAEYLKPEYRGCVDQMSLAIFTARIISSSKRYLDSRCQDSLDKISRSFFEVGKLYAPGIRYTIRCTSVRQRLLSSEEIEFTPDSNLIDCVDALINILTQNWPDCDLFSKDDFIPLLKDSTFINDIGPKLLRSCLSSREDRKIDGRIVLVDLFLNLRYYNLISDYSLFLPFLITWIQEEDFKSKRRKFDNAAALLLLILEGHFTPIAYSQGEAVVTALLTFMERSPPGSTSIVFLCDADGWQGKALLERILKVLDRVIEYVTLSPNQKERLREIYQKSDYQKELPNRIARQIFGENYPTMTLW
ncbi:hypothetical protein DASB73_032550 [Starmerella bacillaris]|uniref:Uncharacterized protein n=1 Tax=Starmerella bacillaris TaxID=1247836 RepID=A0AAV5RM14_STABA|nr:hypothetical protein DASB73_032550 [Starmerella bacillaris]